MFITITHIFSLKFVFKNNEMLVYIMVIMIFVLFFQKIL